MVIRIPLSQAKQIHGLDEAEMIEGYNDGRHNERCGDNRSTAYWHGWRNGMMDGNHMPIDDAARKLVKEFLQELPTNNRTEKAE